MISDGLALGNDQEFRNFRGLRLRPHEANGRLPKTYASFYHHPTMIDRLDSEVCAQCDVTHSACKSLAGSVHQQASAGSTNPILDGQRVTMYWPGIARRRGWLAN